MSQTFFHYRIESDFGLPLPEYGTTSTETIRVTLQSLECQPMAERHEWEGDSPFMYCEKLPTEYDLVFDQYLRARISPEALDVQLHQEGTDSNATVHFLLDQILPRMLGERGELVLHGGAISEAASEASTLVLLGATGSGKSTLCASFLKDGWSLLSDDCVYIDPDTLRVSGSYPGLRMYQDSIDSILGQETTTSFMAGYSDKQRVCTQLPIMGERGLGAFVVLVPGDDQLKVELLGGSEALITVMQETFCLWPSNASAAAARLSALTKVLSQNIPVYRCQLPHDYHGLDEVKTALRELL